MSTICLASVLLTSIMSGPEVGELLISELVIQQTSKIVGGGVKCSDSSNDG